MITKLEQKKKQLEEVKMKISELQKLRKSLYNHIYITEMREKQKKMYIKFDLQEEKNKLALS